MLHISMLYNYYYMPYCLELPKLLSPWLATDEDRVSHVLSHVLWWKKIYMLYTIVCYITIILSIIAYHITIMLCDIIIAIWYIMLYIALFLSFLYTIIYFVLLQLLQAIYYITIFIQHVLLLLSYFTNCMLYITHYSMFYYILLYALLLLLFPLQVHNRLPIFFSKIHLLKPFAV